MVKIFESSEKLRQSEPKRSKHGFPWEDLECGQSFAVPINYMKKGTLRSLVSNRGRELNRKFKMTEHEDCYEVGRIK